MTIRRQRQMGLSNWPVWFTYTASSQSAKTMLSDPASKEENDNKLSNKKYNINFKNEFLTK